MEILVTSYFEQTNTRNEIILAMVFSFYVWNFRWSIFCFLFYQKKKKKKKKKNQRILIEIDTTFGNYELTIANSSQQTHSSKVKKEK